MGTRFWTPRSVAIIGFAVGICWFCFGPAAAGLRADDLESIDGGGFTETLLSDEPIDGDSLSLEPQEYCCQRRPQRWFGRAYGGVSYFDVATGARLGNEYGADLIFPLYRSLAAYGNVSANHFSGGTQFLGTVGLFKAGTVYTCYGMDRIGYGVLFDQFTDSRFDDLYISQLRMGVDYALSGSTTVGAILTEPLEEDVVDLASPGGPASLTDLRTTRAVDFFVLRRVGRAALSASIGYRDVADTVIYGANLSFPVNNRVNTFVKAEYQDVGIWSSFAGLEFRFGRGSSSCGQCCGSFTPPAGSLAEQTTRRVLPADDSSPYEVVRGQPGDLLRSSSFWSLGPLAIAINSIFGSSESEMYAGQPGSPLTAFPTGPSDVWGRMLGGLPSEPSYTPPPEE